MRRYRARTLLWLGIIAASVWIVAHARYVADLTAFLPAKPTPAQRLLVDQLRAGPASRLLLAALEGGNASLRARVSADIVRRLRGSAELTYIDNGTPRSTEHTQQFLFEHRYLLSDAVDDAHFSVDGLHTAIMATIEDLASSSGLLLASLLPHDPTGEMLHVVEQLAPARAPLVQDGVWLSTDRARTLLVAQTSAAGSDTDAQERALVLIENAFRASVDTLKAASTGDAQVSVMGTAAAESSLRLRMSGPGVFAVAARAKIKRAATRLSILSSLLVVGVLYGAYRSSTALALGLLPVVTGALVGVAAVAVCYGEVHGITLGFGATLIGEAVDYSIYFFVQSSHDTSTGTPVPGPGDAWRGRFWPTVRLGMLTSVCGFASLLPSDFPGLAQLGLYSIFGLLAAGLVTRYVLPELLRRPLETRTLDRLGARLYRWLSAARRYHRLVRWILGTTVLCAAVTLYSHRDHLWNRELAALSPLTAADLRFDALLRADLGTSDVLDLVVVRAATLDAVLAGAERARAALLPLVARGVIGEVDSPARYLPSLETQSARRAALPDAATLFHNLASAVRDLPVEAGVLHPFVEDVQAARIAPLLSAEDLRGTSLAVGFNSLVLQGAGGWSALLPLHSAAAGAINVASCAAALATAHLADTEVLDLKAQTDALYAGYLREAMRLSLYGLAAIVILLQFALRATPRTARVLLPLLLSVLLVTAGLAVCGQQLNLLHLVGMLLTIAVGSNYALFFDREGSACAPLTLASLGIANVCTVIGFGLLAVSRVPVLEALGMTVAPGAFLALLLSALLTPRAAAPAYPGSPIAHA